MSSFTLLLRCRRIALVFTPEQKGNKSFMCKLNLAHHYNWPGSILMAQVLARFVRTNLSWTSTLSCWKQAPGRVGRLVIHVLDRSSFDIYSWTRLMNYFRLRYSTRSVELNQFQAIYQKSWLSDDEDVCLASDNSFESRVSTNIW